MIWVVCYFLLDVRYLDILFCFWDKLLEKFLVFLEWGFRYGSFNKLLDVVNVDDLLKFEE